MRCYSSLNLDVIVFIAVSTKHVDSIDAIPNVTFCYPKFFLKDKLQGKGNLKIFESICTLNMISVLYL